MSKKQVLDKIPSSFQKEDFRFLFLFKVIKEQVLNELKKENKNPPNENILNDVCAEAAKDLLDLVQTPTPTKKEISQAITMLKRKLEQNR